MNSGEYTTMWYRATEIGRAPKHAYRGNSIQIWNRVGNIGNQTGTKNVMERDNILLKR